MRSTEKRCVGRAVTRGGSNSRKDESAASWEAADDDLTNPKTATPKLEIEGHHNWLPVPSQDHADLEVSAWSGADDLPDETASNAPTTWNGEGRTRFQLAPTTAWQQWRNGVAVALERPRDVVLAALAREAERGAGLLWAPVFFGLGCMIYFALPREPLNGAFALAALITWVVSRRLRSVAFVGTVLRCIALVALGATAAQLQTVRTSTPTIERSLTAKVVGTVVRAEHRPTGSVRYTLQLDDASRKLVMGRAASAGQRPLIIRTTARKHSDPARVGERVSGTVRVSPPGGPIYPGSYDFGFNSWFSGIGASGFFLGSPTRLAMDPATSSGFRQNSSRAIGQVRENVGLILRENLPGRNGALAAALILGDRSGIDEETQTALRQSGLAHILAISGLHMALVAASVMIAIRGALAAFPGAALHYPTRKWAAATALAASSFYLLLSGGSVSAQRAYVMIAVMLLAILLDRRAVTMRNVAIAAMIILMISPQAILSPGFQMSFAAVAALVATYEAVTKRQREMQRENRAGAIAMVGRFLRRDIGGLALTSLVAGVATALFAAYHFHNVAAWGLLANLLAMPFVTFGVMPLAVVSMIAMRFGLEYFPLTAMGAMTEQVVTIASWVSELSGPNKTGIIPKLALLTGTLGLLIVTLARTRLRWCALPILLVATALIGVREMPDLLILENGRQLGLLDQRGKLHLLRPGADKFSTRVWRNAFEVGAVAEDTLGSNRKRGAKGVLFTCDDFGCTTTTRNGYTIVALESTSRLHEDCALADILVIPFAVPEPCNSVAADQRPLVFDQTALQNQGSVMMFGTGGAVRGAPIQTSPPQGGVSRKERLVNLRVRKARAANPRPWTAHLSPKKALQLSAE